MKKTLGMTTVMAATLAGAPGCSSNDDWNGNAVATRDTAVCVDDTGVRVDDDLCDRGWSGHGGGGGYFHSYYFRSNSALPYYGESVHDPRFRSNGSFSPQAGVNYDRAPVASRMTRSQAVSRGGLGWSGRSFGGGRS